MKKRNYLVVLIALLILMGIPAVAGNTIMVGPTPAANYSTIQAAINAANAGDVITVAPGMYPERVTINKAITLNGATATVSKKGFLVPANYAYDSTTQSIIAPTGLQNEPVVDITSGSVVFDGFVVKSTEAIGYPNYPSTYLIRMTAPGNLNDVIIRNNVLGPVTNLASQDGNTGRAAITISKWSKSPDTRQDNTVYNLQIRNNKIFDAKGDGCGILMVGEKNTTAYSLQNQYKGTVIDNNEITGNHRSGIDFSAGVQGGPNAADHIKITNNLITNNGWYSTIEKDNIKWGNGIVLLRMTNQNETFPWASRYIDIENNVFSGNEKNAIYIGPITRDVTITGNTIQNNGLGTGGYSTWDGIRIDLDEEYQIKERILQREPPLNRDIYNYLTNVVINENKISGNGGYGLKVIQTPQNGPVDARKNSWGSSSGPQNTAINPSGTGNPVSDNVRFAPWYTSDLKTTIQSPAAGAGMTLHVGPGNITTIQKAINIALDGDTIRVAPGQYDERIVINKSITLSGATTGVNKNGYAIPAGYTYDATKESIISPSVNQNAAVVRIETGTVTFDGFVVETDRVNQYPDVTYPETHLIAISNMSHDYSDVRIENKVIGPNTNTGSQDGTKGRSGIALYGPSAALASKITIAHNKIFDAKGDGCGIQLLGSVNDTASQVTTSTRGLTGKYRGSIIDDNEITGNHRAGIELNGGTQGGAAIADHFLITNNNISNNGWGGTADKDNLKFGNGIMLIHVRSDKENPEAFGSQYVDIDNNRITGNEKNGIYMGPVNRDISITNNTIRDNGRGTGGYSIWDSVQIDLDESYHNPEYKNYGFLSNITIRNNELNASAGYGVRVIQIPSKGPVDARNNWWGNASGPKAIKNPSGSGSGASENVAFAPWYTNRLKTATSSLFPAPIATFTVSPVEDMTGQPISFDASGSAGQSTTSIQSYQWDYGDGNTSAASGSPLTSHVYISSKVYTITLTVKDFNAIANQTTRQVSVIAKKDPIPLTFAGTTVSGTTGNQEMTFNSGASSGTMTNTTTSLTIKNPGSGWDEMVVVGNTTGGGGTVTVQNITVVVLKARPSITTLDTTTSEGTAGPGAVTTSIQLSLKQFASAPLQVEVTQGANATISQGFQMAAGSGNIVEAVAYTMTIKGSSLINSNLSSSSAPVILNMSVSEAWVQAHGGISAIKAIRYSDNGDMKEVLETQYLFSAGTPAMYYFIVKSPHGCSIFGIASIVVAPPTSSSSIDSGYSYSSSVGGSDSDASSVSSVSSGAKAQNEEIKVPLQQPATSPIAPTVAPIASPAKVQPRYTLLAEPAVAPVGSDLASEQQGIPGRITAFISGNLIAIGLGAAAITICAGLVIRYQRRKRYWL